MAKRKPVVALVGHPNVGKSTIFNRIIGKRLSIVEDTPGVTRDRLYSDAEWLTREFRLIDTGGIEIKNTEFQAQIKAQAEIAMEEADVIIFVVNGQEGLTRDDEYVAKILYKWDKPIILAVNKIDDSSKLESTQEFWTIGLGEPMPISGEHGIGIGNLLDKVVESLPKYETKEETDVINFALIGMPNVGKSSLVNSILGEERVIVSPIEGTTRDAIDTQFKRNNQKYNVIDTAGLRKKGKVWENIEKYSVLRALSAIDRADIILLVLDAERGIIEQDLHVGAYAHESGKGVIIVVNKWDTVKKDTNTQHEFEKKVRAYFKYLDYAPIVFVSAKENQRVHTVFEKMELVYNALTIHIPTSTLNEIINNAVLYNEPPIFNGDRLKILYGTQVATKPPTIILFVNDPQHMHFSYLRYLENKLREAFGFEGTPLKIIPRIRK